MQVYKDINKLPIFRNAVITIGTFDGVHQGHVTIIRQLLREARHINGTAVLVTFHPHPKQVVETGRKPILLLNTPEEKYTLLHKHGIDHIVEVPFNKEFSEQSASDYIHKFLVSRFHPHTIIIGYDHRFGKNREGDYRLLESASGQAGFTVKEIPEHVLQNVTISSTRIREALLAGNIETANDFLGYDYFFSGLVVEGDKIGRTIGYPTANIHPENAEKLIPGNGVYAVDVVVRETRKQFRGMMNIGVRPTLNGSRRMIEVNMFDFVDTIYGYHLKVSVRKRLRDEIKFAGLEELKDQLAKDKLAAQ